MNNSFDKPCAELSLLKLCHGEKECHEMERFASERLKRAESPTDHSPGHRPGDNSNQQDAL